MDNKKTSLHLSPYVDNIEETTIANEDFRKVVYTGPNSQLVFMSLLPGEDIGSEVHTVDQFFRIESGNGVSIIEGKEYQIMDGTALLIPAGLEHNIMNSGTEPLRLYTLYSPPNHIDGRVHKTKQDALNDAEDEAFGEKAGK